MSATTEIIKAINYGEDFWGRQTVVTKKTKKYDSRTLKMIDGRWHTSTPDGEPDCPIKKEIIIEVEKNV